MFFTVPADELPGGGPDGGLQAQVDKDLLLFQLHDFFKLSFHFPQNEIKWPVGPWVSPSRPRRGRSCPTAGSGPPP